MKAALGLDVGTTSVKAVVVASDGRVIGQGTSGSLAMRSPHPGWAVQASADLVEAVKACLKATVSSLPADTDIQSLTAAVQSGSVIDVDQDGVPGVDLTTWMDTRCEPLVRQWKADGSDDRIRQLCGWSVQPGQGLPQLAWLRDNDPIAWNRVDRIASADDLVTNRLTGEWVTNPSNAAGMALMDLSSGQWSSELCGLIGIEAEQLSDLRPSGERIGSITPEIITGTGLQSGLDVFNGGHDQACAALALGVTEPSQALLAGGTAWVLTNVVSPDAAVEVPTEMNVSFHVVPEARTASTYLGGMGASIEWWLTTQDPQPTGEDRFAVLDEKLATATTSESSPYFLPSLAGSAASKIPGSGRFVNTDTSTTDGERARSIMEHAAFRLRTSIESLPESHRPQTLTVVGGVTRASHWVQLIADVSELPVIEAANPSLPALGAAALGGVASGVFTDIESAVASLKIARRDVEPNGQKAEVFRRRHQNHLEQEKQK